MALEFKFGALDLLTDSTSSSACVSADSNMVVANVLSGVLGTTLVSNKVGVDT